MFLFRRFCDWLTGKTGKIEATIEAYRQENEQLRKEIVRLEGVELKLKIAELYIEDNAAIEELINYQIARDKEKNYHQAVMSGMAASQKERDEAIVSGIRSGIGSYHHQRFINSITKGLL